MPGMTDPAPIPEKLRSLPMDVVARRLRLAPGQEPLLKDAPSPAMLLQHLVEAGLFAEAARLLCYALPEREAVWWACMCAVHATADPLPEPERHALLAAEAWVRRPDEAARRSVGRAAARAGYDTPAAWAARAGYSCRLDLPLHTRGGKRVEAAIAGAAACRGAPLQTERLRRFIASARDIAAGGAGRLAPGSVPGGVPGSVPGGAR